MIHLHPYFLRLKTVLHGLIIVLLLIFTAGPAGTAEQAQSRNDRETPSEYELKAIYLYNFLKFVQWPEKCPLPEGKAQEIGVLGDSAFEPVLIELQEKLKTKNQQLKLIFYGPYHEGMDLSTCCLLFISSSELKNLPRILASLKNKPVLTVADSDAYMDKGVMITLISRENKVRWAINREPVRNAGLRLSAKLLDIAIEVIN